MRGKVRLHQQSLRESRRSSIGTRDDQQSSSIERDDLLMQSNDGDSETFGSQPTSIGHSYNNHPVRRSAELTQSVAQRSTATPSLYSSYLLSSSTNNEDQRLREGRIGSSPSIVDNQNDASTLFTASTGIRPSYTRSFVDDENTNGRTSGTSVDPLPVTTTVVDTEAAGNTEDESSDQTEASEASEEGGSNDDDDDLDEKNLTEDTYSFMVSSPVMSVPFCVSIIVAGLQFITFFLLAFSIVDVNDRANPFKIPVAVSPPVRMAQIVAILLSVVATPSDIHSALDLARDGLTNNEQFLSAFEDACCSKFVLSIVIRVFLGAVGMILMFALIVSAETVIDLLLNFTALEFVTLIDEAFFIFAKEGFLGGSCESKSTEIEVTTYKAPKRQYNNRILKYLVTAMFLVAYFIGWTVVAKKQQNASMICSKILVQFGDDHQPEIGTFAGIYDKQVNPNARIYDSMRVSYVQRGYTIGTGGSFSYCDNLKVWTFRWPSGNHSKNNTAPELPADLLGHINGPVTTYKSNVNNNNIFHHDEEGQGYDTTTSNDHTPPSRRTRRWLKTSKKGKTVDQGDIPEGGDAACGWKARSSETETYDLTSTVESPWYIQDENGREILLEPVVISCIDCQGVDDCSGRGACTDGICSCDDGWSGLRCEFLEPCRALSMDQRFGGFPGLRSWPMDYELLVDGNGKPVYSSNKALYIGVSYSDTVEEEPKRKFTVVEDIDNESPEEESSSSTQQGSGSLAVIFFTGRRWAAAFVENLFDVTTVSNNMGKNETMSALADYFKDDFHGYWSNYTAEYLSSPMDIEQAGDAMSPLYVHWFWAEGRHDRMSTAAARVEVQAPNLALSVDARFLCTVCDINTNPCRYDGWCSAEGFCRCAPGSQGKLCEVAPVGDGLCHPFYNSAEYNYDQGDCCESTCVSTLEFQCGYDAHGTIFLGYPWCSLEPGQWYGQGNSIVGEHVSGAGASVALANRGSILAVAEPGKHRVILYDKDGSEWIEREGPYEIEERTFDTTINSLSMASAPGQGHLLKTGSDLVPVLMVFTESDFRGTSPLIYCSTKGCETKEQFQGATSIAISGDGSRIVLGNARISLQRDPWPRNNTVVEVVDVYQENLDEAYMLHQGIVSYNTAAGFDPLTVANYVSVNGNDCDSLTLLRSVSLSHDASILAVEVGEWIGCEDSDWGPRPQLETEDGEASNWPNGWNESGGGPQSGRPEGSSRRPEGSSGRPEGSNGRPEGSNGRPNGGNNGRQFGRPQTGGEEGGGRPQFGGRPNGDEGSGRPQIEEGVGSSGKPQMDDVSAISHSIYMHTSVYTFQWSGTNYINPSLVTNGRTTLANKRPTFAMSDNGRVLVSNTGRCTHAIFSWDGSSWIEGGKLVSNEDPCQFTTYAISSDGSTVALGADTGAVQVYRWNGVSLIPAAQGFESGANHSTALSGDGNTLAIGLPMSQAKSAGSTSVYSSPPEATPKNQSLLRLQVTPYSNETKYVLQSTSNNDTLVLGEASLWALATATEGIAIQKDDCLMLTIQVSNHSCNEIASYKKSCETWHPTLPDPRFDVFVDGKPLAGGSLKSEKVRLSGACGGEYRYPPRRALVGNCNSCSGEGQELIQIATSTCYPGEAWRLENGNGQSLLSFDSSTEQSSLDIFGYNWKSVCVNLEDDCFAFSTSTSTDIQDVAPLQFTQYNRTQDTQFAWAGAYFLYVGDQLLAGGRYSTLPTPPPVHFGKCTPSSFTDPPLTIP